MITKDAMKIQNDMLGDLVKEMYRSGKRILSSQMLIESAGHKLPGGNIPYVELVQRFVDGIKAETDKQSAAQIAEMPGALRALFGGDKAAEEKKGKKADGDECDCIACTAKRNGGGLAGLIDLLLGKPADNTLQQGNSVTNEGTKLKDAILTADLGPNNSGKS